MQRMSWRNETVRRVESGTLALYEMRSSVLRATFAAKVRVYSESCLLNECFR